MTRDAHLSRRGLFRWGLRSTALALLAHPRLLAQAGGRTDATAAPGEASGGGQRDIRLTVDAHNSDPDIVEIRTRIKPYDADSWITEYARQAEKNERLADQLAQDGHKIAASERYLRASTFYATGVWPAAEDDPRMLPMANKLVEVTDKAYRLAPPPFERVHIAYPGAWLTAYFTKPRGAPGTRFPAVFTYGSADAFVINGESGNAYTARGMAHLAMDCPGQGTVLRLEKRYAPPDSERVARAVLDYLVQRPDVDASRIGICGVGTGGYGAPRCASGESRIKACAVTNGVFSMREDVFDFYPPIQDQIRWMIGAKDVADARTKTANFTLERRAQLIECPMLIGYNKDDRIIDPRGAQRLNQAAVNSKRELVEGIGHRQPANAGGLPQRWPPIIADWMATRLGADGVSAP